MSNQESNHLYNILTQLTQEMRSLWRIEKHYVDESTSEEEKVFWRNLKEDKANHIKELKDLAKSLLD